MQFINYEDLKHIQIEFEWRGRKLIENEKDIVSEIVEMESKKLPVEELYKKLAFFMKKRREKYTAEY